MVTAHHLSQTMTSVLKLVAPQARTGAVQELAILHNYFPFVNCVFFGYCRLGLHLPYRCNAMTIFLVWIVLDLAVVDLDFDCLIGTSRVSQSLQAYSTQYVSTERATSLEAICSRFTNLYLILLCCRI
jgi:hypothetical protein